jgi:hypothetical protein
MALVTAEVSPHPPYWGHCQGLDMALLTFPPATGVGGGT